MTNKQQNTLDIAYFGDNLKRVRIMRKLSREEFADRIGVSSRIIYDYEEGFKTPKLETAIKIAIVLEVTLDSILRLA